MSKRPDFTGIILLAMATTLAVGESTAAGTYYVSPSGRDANAGTSEGQPFQSVQHAVDAMKGGDSLVVLDGVYTGTLKLKSGVTVRAKNPRQAIFSGAEELQGAFKKHAKNIYKIKVATEPKQVFYRDQPMTWARWPNMNWSENWDRSKKWSNGDAGYGTLKCDGFSELKGLKLTGGYCFLRFSKGNSCYSRLIKGFDGTTLKWNDTDFYNRLFTGEDGKRGRKSLTKKPNRGVRAVFFLAGALDLLDHEGEWFAKDGWLYVYAAAGRPPKAEDFLIKTNDYSVFEEDALSDVTIEGVDFLATSLKLANAGNQNIRFQDVQFSYIGAEHLFVDNLKGNLEARPVYVAGSRIAFERCLFAGATNTALDLSGSMLSVRNSVFMENNRHGNFQSVPLVIRAAGTFDVTRNTFFNNCSDALRVHFEEPYERSRNPEVSYNNICNAGIYNSDVSGVYFPNLTQHDTEFHHNWVHNVEGSGVRLDQAGEEFTVHHNVFWSSKRGMSIEGYGKFNVYNNTSFRHTTADALIRNVLAKPKGSNAEMVSNDMSFPPIDDWNVVNNLLERIEDGVGPSERWAFDEAKEKGLLHPERAKNKGIPFKDRGAIQGNLTGFKAGLFVNGNLDGLNLIPNDRQVEGGVAPNPRLIAEGVADLGTYRGAYAYRDDGWSTGSDWMPYGIKVPVTMAEAERFAEKFAPFSVVPTINVAELPRGQLSANTYRPAPVTEAEPSDDGLTKKQRNRKRRRAEQRAAEKQNKSS